jgi:hypothetical protein
MSCKRWSLYHPDTFLLRIVSMWHGVRLAVVPEVAAAGVPTVVMEVWAAAAAIMVAQVVMVVEVTVGGVTAVGEKAAECLARVTAVVTAVVETAAVRVVVWATVTSAATQAAEVAVEMAVA